MADSKQYIEQVLKERQEREDRFKNSERGWLGLVGLYWLRDGENRIGSDVTNDIVLPPVAPANIGIVQYNNSVATFRAARGVPIYCNGKQVTLKTLVADIYEDKADFLQVGDFTLVLLERAGRHLIRVWDKNSELRRSFSGFNQYPVDPAYCIKAKYTAYDVPKLISIQDVIEIYHETPFQGYVTFELQGKEYCLEARTDEEYMRLDFLDATNGDTTYVGGRFLIAEMPKEGEIIVDFNRAYNPPCAYTDYATCPLPPPENHLPIRIEAGEKVFREDGHGH